MLTKNEILSNEVRALSWKQPYADLMIRGKQETRKWKTNYRGLVLICASKASYTQAEINTISGEEQARSIDNLYNFLDLVHGVKDPYKVTGKAIAVGRITDCRPMAETEQNTTFVKYRPGLFVFEFKDVTPIVPFNWSGIQGWRTLSEEEKQKIFFRELCQTV